MISKKEEKKLAIALRKEGKTYSEILSAVPVCKSTLSLWLQSVRLAKKQKQRITVARVAGQKKGAEVRRRQRIERQQKIYAVSKLDISSITA